MLQQQEGNSKTSMVVVEESIYRSTRTRPYYFRRCKRVQQQPTNIESLPNELLSDILVRLPADYLYDRARLVCRTWYHIIQSDAFVSKQVEHSTYGLILSCYNTMWGGQCHHPIFMTATATQGRVEISEFSYKFTRPLLMGCNGLTIESNHRTVYIMNPVTKQSLVLPPVPVQVRIGIPYVHECRIAFAASSNKYKLILPYLNMMNYRETSLAILTVGVDNSWRNIEVEHLPTHARIGLRYAPVATEGFFHWTRMGSSMLTMDVETEIITLREIDPRPRGCIQLCHLSTGRLLSRLVGFEDFSWEIWGMNSETGEWRKVLPDIKLGGLLHQFASTGKNEELRDLLASQIQVLVPLGWVKYPEVLALGFSGRSGICILYNLDTHQINSTKLPHCFESYNRFVHKNSLMGLA